MFAYFLMESTDCNSEQHTCQLFLMSLILLTIGKTKVLHFYWNYFFISLAFQLDGIFLCKSFCLLKWSKPIWTQNNFTTKLGMVSSFFYFRHVKCHFFAHFELRWPCSTTYECHEVYDLWVTYFTIWWQFLRCMLVIHIRTLCNLYNNSSQDVPLAIGMNT